MEGEKVPSRVPTHSAIHSSLHDQDPGSNLSSASNFTRSRALVFLYCLQSRLTEQMQRVPNVQTQRLQSFFCLQLTWQVPSTLLFHACTLWRGLGQRGGCQPPFCLSLPGFPEAAVLLP